VGSKSIKIININSYFIVMSEMNKLLWSPAEIENSQAWKFIQEINQKHNLKLINFHEPINNKTALENPEVLNEYYNLKELA
jgi:hypothetical protein